MKKSLFLLIFQFWFFFLLAQEATLKVIRERYTLIQQAIEDDVMRPVLLNFDINHRAIGVQSTKVAFYWDYLSGESYQEKGDAVKVSFEPHLAMVRINYNIAASEWIHIEYVFDTTGKLIFYFHKNLNQEMQETKTRLYFEEGKLIKKMYSISEMNQEKGTNNIITEKNISKAFLAEDEAFAKEVMQNAAKYQKQFLGLFQIEGLH